MYAIAKIANLAKNRQTADENLNEVTKLPLTKWRGWQKWRIWQNSPWDWKTFKLNDKSGLLESGDHDENGEYDENSESSQRAGENFNKIRRGAPCKDEKLTEWWIWQKWWVWQKIYHGFNKYSSWDAKSGPLESGEFDENGEQGENDEFGDNSPKMQ